MSKDAVKSVAFGSSNTDGALIAPTFICMDDAANLLNTATAIVSMPCKFPALSSIGTVIMIFRLAKGETLCVLLLGEIYGSPGATTTLLAIKVLGGYEYVFQTFGLSNTAAIAALRVVIAAVIIRASIRDFGNRLSGL